MSKLLKQIDQIELKIKSLINENIELKEKLQKSDRVTGDLEKQLLEAQSKMKESEETIVVLKTANAMLGSDDYKTKTKLKINALVREIDQCIAQLA